MNNPLFFFASEVGGTTLDQGEGGGNPFASALVELLARRHLTLKELTVGLDNLTVRKSSKFQRPDLPALADLQNWLILPNPSRESRVALVLVFSDYSASGGSSSLPGARHDAHRIAVALERAGFETQKAIDPTRHGLGGILQDFASRSSSADVALLYTTGHGVHVAGVTYLLPGNYPVSEGNLGLANYALRVSELAGFTRAKHRNLIFYGGCRNDPFQQR